MCDVDVRFKHGVSIEKVMCKVNISLFVKSWLSCEGIKHLLWILPDSVDPQRPPNAIVSSKPKLCFFFIYVGPAIRPLTVDLFDVDWFSPFTIDFL
jgi:hypothetical protein